MSMPQKNPPGPDLSVVDAATRARSTETVKTVNPHPLQFPGVAAAVTARWQGPTTMTENNERGPARPASSPVFRPITKPLS
jgi:hypothetical protein